MHPAPAADDGDPAKPVTRPALRILFIFALTGLFACQEKTASPTVSPSPDTVKTAEKKRAGSILPDGSSKKKIYLTFDDGPNKGTRNVLQIIREEQVPASFFVVAVHSTDTRQQKETWEILRADSLIDLCNHSYSHARNRYNSYYENPAAVIEDFNQAQQLLGLSNRIARTPGRNIWRIDSIRHTDIFESSMAADSLYAAGYDLMGWDIEWTFHHRTLRPDADTGLLLRRIYNLLESGKTRTPGHLVLLAHDQAYQKETYREELRYIIRQLKQNPAYQLELITRYPGIRKSREL